MTNVSEALEQRIRHFEKRDTVIRQKRNAKRGLAIFVGIACLAGYMAYITHKDTSERYSVKRTQNGFEFIDDYSNVVGYITYNR